MHISQVLGQDEYFITGSYDDHIRLWDLREMHKPVTEVNTGGGVWDCVRHPEESAR